MENKRKTILSFDSLEIGFISGKTRKVLLPPLNATASEGELIAVIGRNGIGKSTLLRSLTGLQRVLSGNLLIDGTDIHNYSRITLSEKVGYISTEIIRVSNMKVYDLVSLGRFPYTNWYGRMDPLNHNAVMEAINKAGMSEFTDRPIIELSDGERQRAMIAMELAQDAIIMIMDEPTAFLDISSKFDVIHLMHELTRQRNKTIIYSTHDFMSAISQADKIWLMLEDKLIEGAPEDIMINGYFKSLFDESKVSFNTHDGSFNVRREPNGEVMVTGAMGVKRYWTEKALNRAGFTITSSCQENTIVVPDEPGHPWKCNIHGAEEEFYTLYDMICWFNITEISS